MRAYVLLAHVGNRVTRSICGSPKREIKMSTKKGIMDKNLRERRADCCGGRRIDMRYAAIDVPIQHDYITGTPSKRQYSIMHSMMREYVKMT